MNYRNIEKVIKGFSNHRRIQILYLLKHEPELSVGDISEKLNVDYKTISQHVIKMEISGLIMKRNDFNNVRHKLTKRGLDALQFCRIVE